MKPKDIFNLAVRLLGLLFVYHGLSSLPVAVSTIVSSLMMGRNLLGFITSLIFALWPLAVAYWLLRGGRPLVCIAYPLREESSKEAEEIKVQHCQ